MKKPVASVYAGEWTLRGLPDVRIRHRNVLTTTLDAQQKAERGLPADGFDVILANPPFSGRADKDRVVEDVKIGNTTATEILFLKYMLDNLKPDGRCGVIVPEGVLFLHADADGYKLDANHDTPVEADDLPGLAEVCRQREALPKTSSSLSSLVGGNV